MIFYFSNSNLYRFSVINQTLKLRDPLATIKIQQNIYITVNNLTSIRNSLNQKCDYLNPEHQSRSISSFFFFFLLRCMLCVYYVGAYPSGGWGGVGERPPPPGGMLFFV